MPAAQEYWFDHEKLDVYQDAIVFNAWLTNIMEELLRVGKFGINSIERRLPFP